MLKFEVCRLSQAVDPKEDYTFNSINPPIIVIKITGGNPEECQQLRLIYNKYLGEPDDPPLQENSITLIAYAPRLTDENGQRWLMPKLPDDLPINLLLRRPTHESV